VRALLRFGGPVQGVDLAIYLISTLDNVAVGRFMGATELGLYGRAFQLLTMPVSLVTLAAARFAVPALSRLYLEPARYRRYFRVAVELVAAIAWPMVTSLLLIGDDLVLLLLGPDWLRAALLFRLLAAAALVVPILHTLGWVCLSTGTVRRQFLWSATFVPLFAAAFLVGALSGGTEGVALACSAMNLVFFGVGVGYCLHGSPVRPGDVAAALWRPLGVVILTTIGSAIIVTHLPWHVGPGVRLTLTLGVFCALYLSAYLAVPGGRTLISGVMATLGWRGRNDQQEG
jgi:O-antigen/teichoic acid export membrane protein